MMATFRGCRVDAKLRTASSGSPSVSSASRTIVTALLVLACTCALPQADEPLLRLQQMRARAQDVIARMAAGEDVKIIAFGDSLTAGWGTDGRHMYHKIATDVLRYRFPDSPIQLVTRGHPGETTGGALNRLQAEVIASQPDLALIQFGGNDMGWGRSVRAFERDLSRLLRLASDNTNALIIACLPPIIDADPANVWSETARNVAARVGVPAADLDRAIRNADPDFRGPFPYESHPGGFTHVVMGREVLRALDEAAGVTPRIDCTVQGGTKLAAGQSHQFTASIRSVADVPLECEASLEFMGQTRTHNLRIEPRGTGTIRQQIPLPFVPFPGHSYRLPIRLLVRSNGHAAADISWLAVAPAITADKADNDTLPIDDLAWHDIPDSAITLGRHNWLGPGDLNSRFAVVILPDRIRFIVAVIDDSIAVADLSDPSQGDSVELYLDLRGRDDQAKPVYSPDVLAIQVIPPEPDGHKARWRSMQALPEDLKSIRVSCALSHDGYRTRIDLPLAPVKARRGDHWEGLGFDVGVNDADFGGTRQTQVMWCGFPDNYLNPAYLAGLYIDRVEPGATRRTIR